MSEFGSLRGRLIARALELGFDGCRITDGLPPTTGPQFLSALQEGRHAGMGWLARTADKRVDLEKVLPGIRSVVTLAVSYSSDVPRKPVRPSELHSGIVARYACYDDYHEALQGPLKVLVAILDEAGGLNSRSLAYVDTGPILERDLAQRAGLGFIGKHTGLISRQLGNWFLLAEILTTVPLPTDEPEPNRCGHCTRCLEACPTGALPAPFTLDARRCIAYLTIEHKGSIPMELRPMIGGRIFGCDDCLEVCPWNRFAIEGRLLREHRREDLDQPNLLDLLKLDATAFRRQFRGTPMERTRRRGLIRNVCVALGNVGTVLAVPDLEVAATDPEPLIAEHALWAISHIHGRLSNGSSKSGRTSDSSGK